MESKKILLLDVSALVFRAYFALPELTTSDGKPAGALYGFLSILLKTIQDRKPTHIAAAIDLPGKTFRHDLYAEYKATRSETPEDLISQFPMVYEALAALGIPVLGAEGFEADDVLATLAKQVGEEDKKISIEIESGDQDLLQLVDARVTVLAPGRVSADIKIMDADAVMEKLGVSPERVIEYKALRGDTSDNIPGVRGIGPKTATALLEYADSLETLLKEAKNPRSDAPKELTRFGEKLLAAKDDLYRDRKLVTLREDAPITFSLKEAASAPAPPLAFTALLTRWGFATLLKRFSGVDATKKKKDDTKQGSLGFEKEESLDDFISAQEKQVEEEIAQKVEAEEFSEQIAKLERDLVPIISSMEREGIAVDVAALRALEKRFTKKRDDIAKKIYKVAGHEFNLASPKQLAEVLYDEIGIQARKKTAKGQRSTAAAVLEDMKDAHPVIADVLAWREISKLLSTYVTTLPALVAKDGRIHARFWQLGTVTGRIASSDPNLQNIPTRTEDGKAVRSAFIAPAGSLLISADYSQVELRVAAVLADEEGMLAVFKKGEDIHSATAERVFHVSAGDVSAEMRRRAKILNFGMLYGMGAQAVSKQMEVPYKEGVAFRESYFAAFPKLTGWMERVVQQARKNGFTETAFGRRRAFPELSATNPGLRARAERAAINAPVQGTATGDLVKIGMVSLLASNPPLKLLVQVHDELLCEVVDADVDEAVLALYKYLESVWPSAPVAFPVHIKVGKNWGNMQTYQV